VAPQVPPELKHQYTTKAHPTQPISTAKLSDPPQPNPRVDPTHGHVKTSYTGVLDVLVLPAVNSTLKSEADLRNLAPKSSDSSAD